VLGRKAFWLRNEKPVNVPSVPRFHVCPQVFSLSPSFLPKFSPSFPVPKFSRFSSTSFLCPQVFSGTLRARRLDIRLTTQLHGHGTRSTRATPDRFQRNNHLLGPCKKHATKQSIYWIADPEVMPDLCMRSWSIRTRLRVNPHR
jgi:hypothetical protein